MKAITTLAALLVSLSLAAFSPRAEAAIFLLSATINGAQANMGMGTGSAGIGTMTGSYDDGGTPMTGGLLSWNISWSGLSGTATAAHFHGPALPGENAAVEVGFGTTNPNIDSANISAAQAADLLAGLWYINIHSTVNTGGEIRGQVVPEPGAALLVGAGFLPFFFRRRRRLS